LEFSFIFVFLTMIHPHQQLTFAAAAAEQNIFFKELLVRV
jgi:hypothetical protein